MTMANPEQLTEIEEHLRGMVKDDSTFQALTGASGSDSRMYYGWPNDKIVLRRSQPAYVTFFEMAGGGTPPDAVHVVQRPDKWYQFDVWSRTPHQAKYVEGRLEDILYPGYTFTTATYKVGWLLWDGRNEMLDDPNPESMLWRISKRFQLGGIVTRAGRYYSNP